MATVSLSAYPVPEIASCPDCGSDLELYDPKGSEFCICKACHSYLEFVGDNPKHVKKLKPVASRPVIPLGSEGILEGHLFKVIAYLEKDEKNPSYAWREYFLYNFEKGYAFLSEYDGHWNLILGKNFLPGLEKPLDGGDYIMFEDVEYKLFHKYEGRVIAGIGEFDWDIISEDLKITEFVSPPYVMVKETGVQEWSKKKDFYRGVYLEDRSLADAFGLDVNQFPSKVGILSNEPSKAFEQWNWIFKKSLYLILALCLVELLVVFFKTPEVLVDSEYNISYDRARGMNEFKPFKTSSFDVKDASSALDIEIRSEVSNNWLEATIVLVNEASNETWEVTKGVEYYSGYEGGESWHEGSKEGSVLLSAIPKGSYHLNVYTASGDPLRDLVAIKIEANGTLWRNVVSCILIFCIVPAYCFFRMRGFERRRWSNSDYSPFEA